jgi:hypothetical protein
VGAEVGVGVGGRDVFVGVAGTEVLVGVNGGAVELGVKEAVTTSFVRVISASGSSGVDISSHDDKVNDANRRMMTIKYLVIFDLL